MKTASLLIHVPPTKKSAYLELKEFREKHGILTHSASWARKDHPWLALQAFDADKGKDIALIIAESCRLYEEAGYLSTGQGELSAVRALCEKLNILCPL